MSSPLPMKSSITNDSVARYVAEKINPDSALEKKLRIETHKLPQGGMISGSDVSPAVIASAKEMLAKRKTPRAKIQAKAK